MKTSLLLLLSACLPFAGQAQTPADTLADVRRPEHVLVVRNDSVLNIRVKGSENDHNYVFNYSLPYQGNTSFVEEAGTRWDFTLPRIFNNKRTIRKRTKRQVEWTMALRFGALRTLNADGGLRTQFGSSFEIEGNFMSFAYTVGRHSLITGWGYAWARYRLDGAQCFNFDGERVAVGDYPTGSKVGRSVFRLNRHVVPALYRYRFGKKWNVTAGALLQFNVRPRIYNTYYVGNKEVVDTYKKNIPIRPVTAALYGSLVYDDLGLYVRYQPTSVFTKDFGPQFNSLSMGLTLGF